MKKLYSTIMMLAMMVAALGLTACGGDDEEDDAGGTISSSLVGTWDVVRSVYYLDGEEYISDDSPGYCVFSANKVTYHEADDLYDGITYDYTFRGNKLTIGDFPWTVIELTSSKLVIRAPVTTIGDSYKIIEFKKRKKHSLL